MNTHFSILALCVSFLVSISSTFGALIESRTVGNTAYFIQSAPGRVDRYDLASRQWLSSVTLPAARGTPTCGHVDADGIYVTYGTAVYRYSLTGTGEVHLVNAPSNPIAIHTDGNLLFVNHSTSLYAKVISINKSTNNQIAVFENYIDEIHGSSIAPSVNKMFGRTTGVSPADITFVSYNDAGVFSGGGGSPHHGDYPSALRTWVFPDEAKVLDDAGMIYSTGDLSYVGSLGGAVNQVAFVGTNIPIVLRGAELIAYNVGLLPVGNKVLTYTPTRIFVNAQDVIAFTVDATPTTGLRVNVIPLSTLSAPLPGAPIDPNGLPYTPDHVFQDNAGVVNLFSKAKQSIFRWSVASQSYLPTIPLVGIPSYATYSSALNRVYLAYPTGLIRKIDLADPTLAETPFCAVPLAPWGVTAAGRYLFSADASGAWGSHYTFDEFGTLITEKDWNYFSTEYIWSDVTQKMYFFRDDTSPNDLIWEQINANGSAYPLLAPGAIGADFDSPLHESNGFSHPIRVSPNGTIVVLGSGMVHDATTLARLPNSLANSVVDTAWAGGHVQTMRTMIGVTQFQQWTGATYAPGVVKQVPGTAHRMISLANGKLFAVTLVGGIPSFYVMDADFNLASPTELAAPLGLAASVTGVNQVTLNWGDVNGEQEFFVERRRGADGVWQEIGTTTASVTVYQDSGFTNGDTYFYRVAARSGAVVSAYSAIVEILLAVPAIPQNLLATKQDQQISVTWTDTANETSYQLDRRIGATGTWTQIATPTAGAVSYVDSTVQLATEYFYRIRAINALGASANSDVSSAATDYPLPTTPNLSQPQATQSHTVSVAWGHSLYEANYVLERRTGANGVFAVIASPAMNVTTYSDTNVLPLTTYGYRIKGVNPTGDSAYSAILSVTTPNVSVPVAPTDLVARSSGPTSVRISWNDVGAETGYRLERRGDSPNWTVLASLAPNATNYDDEGLTQGHQYFYRVFAFNAGGSSLASNVDDATPLPYAAWLVDDFDPALGSMWKAVSGATVTNGDAGFLDSRALWFGAATPRVATTIPVDSTQGGFVNFKLRAGNSAVDGTTHWDDSEAGETVVLEYSQNGTAWAALQHFNTVAPNFSAWQTLSIEIPTAARSEATQFRWRQLAHTGPALDTWALEDVEVQLIARPLLAGPASLLAMPNSSSEVTLWWAAVDGALDYIIEQSAGGIWSQVMTVPASTTFATITELDSLTFYNFRIRAANPAGTSAPSRPALVRTWAEEDGSAFPGTFVFRNAEISVQENGTTLRVEVLRQEGSSQDVAVTFSASNGTATQGDDFTASGGTLAFADGQKTQAIEIPILQDQLIESDEQFTITLSAPTNGSRLGDLTQTRATIIDDDKPGTLAFSEPVSSVNEATATRHIKVRRSLGSAGPVSVSYDLGAEGSASHGADFSVTSGTLEFANGETEKTIAIELIDDALGEFRESFILALSNPTGGASLGSRKQHLVEILDDEGVDIRKSSFAGIVKGRDSGQNTGLVRFSLTPAGSLTGRITTRSLTTKFSGRVDGTGQMTFTQKSSKQAASVSLSLDAAGDEFTISYQDPSGAWFDCEGERILPAVSSTLPKSGVAQTLLMSGVDANDSPIRGVGRVHISPARVAISGKVPNGLPFSSESAVTISGRIALMAITAKKSEHLCGWLTPEGDAVDSALAGDLNWNRKVGEDIALVAETSPFVRPATDRIIQGLNGFGDATIVLSGGGLDAEIEEAIRVSAKNVIRLQTPSTTTSISLLVAPRGNVDGTYSSPSHRRLKLHGSVLLDPLGGFSKVEGLWCDGEKFGTWHLLPE